MMPSTPIADFARRYSSSGTARLHMPGHKGVSFLGCEPLDLTEIAGADELYEAEGIIAESEANAAQLFGTAATYYSAGGSSQCIRAMLLLAMQAAPAGEGRPVLLAARNAHKALVYSAALLDFEIQWLWPQGQGGSVQLPGHACQSPHPSGAAAPSRGAPLWRLPDQPGLSGVYAGRTGAGRGLPKPVRAAAGGQRTRRLSALFAGGQPAPDRTGGCYVLRLRS